MEIIYSDKPLTLGQMADAQLSAKGDYAALVRYIVSRTNLTEEQVRNLDMEEASRVIVKVGEMLVQALALMNLGSMLDDLHKGV